MSEADCTSNGLLCDTGWLDAHLGDSELITLDCDPLPAHTRFLRLPTLRKRFIRSSVFRGPTAAWRPIGTDGVERAVGDGDAAASLLGQLGITRHTIVVCASRSAGLWATFIWSVLDRFGHPRCQVIDGGVERWTAEGRPMARPHRRPAAATYATPPLESPTICTLANVATSLEQPDHVFWDLRCEAEWRGDKSMGARRGGHIPGAVLLEWNATVSADGTFKPMAELRPLLARAGITPDKMVTTYCHGGVRAAFGMFVLRLLGYPRVRVYDASWAEYGNAMEMPAVKA